MLSKLRNFHAVLTAFVMDARKGRTLAHRRSPQSILIWKTLQWYHIDRGQEAAKWSYE